MTNPDIAAAWAELQQTTLGYQSVKHYPPDRYARTHWARAEGLLFPPVVTPPPPVLPPVSHSPVNTSGMSQHTFAPLNIDVPLSLTDINATPFYINGPCDHLTLTGPGRLSGGYNVVKVYTGTYAGIHDVTLDGYELTAGAGDCIHIDGPVRFHIDNIFAHDPLMPDGPPAPPDQEHKDGCQIQAGEDIYLGPGCLFQWKLMKNGQPFRRDDTSQGGGQGIFINPVIEQGRPLRRVTLDRIRVISWWPGRAIQMLQTSGRIVSPDIQDCGLPSSPLITLSRPHIWTPGDSGQIILEPASTGIWSSGLVNRKDVAFNDFGGSGWPDYVTVLS